jgi:hypothetical protein
MVDFEKLKSHIEMTVTAEGLRIELSESAKPAEPLENRKLDASTLSLRLTHRKDCATLLAAYHDQVPLHSVASFREPSLRLFSVWLLAHRDSRGAVCR